VLTQKLFGGLLGKISESNGCPTTRGLVLHTIVYILLVRGSMGFEPVYKIINIYDLFS